MESRIAAGLVGSWRHACGSTPGHLHAMDKVTNEFRHQKKKSVLEAVHWSCSRVLPNHVWISEFSLTMHEDDILERLNASTKENLELVNERRMPETYVALEAAFNIPTLKTHSPKLFLLTAQSLITMMTYGAWSSGGRGLDARMGDWRTT